MMIWSTLVGDNQFIDINFMIELKPKKFDRFALGGFENPPSAFSQEQQDILIGTLLGDASMQKVAKTQESNIK